MKILQITPTFIPSHFGGVKTVSFSISKNLAIMGHDVVVYTTDADIGKKRLKDLLNNKGNSYCVEYFKNVNNFIAYKYRIFSPISMFFRLRKEICKFDIVHIHDYRNFLTIISCYFAMKKNIPYVLQVHGDLPYSNQKVILKKLFDSFFSFIITNASCLIALNKNE